MTITIYTNTHRQACLDFGGATEQDAKVYDQNIQRYWDYLNTEAEKYGVSIRFESNSAGISYSADDNDEHNFMSAANDFWSWYN